MKSDLIKPQNFSKIRIEYKLFGFALELNQESEDNKLNSTKFRLFSFLARPLVKHLGFEFSEKSRYPNLTAERSASLLLKIFSNYLSSSGWVETQNAGKPVRNGMDIPWLTYPAIEVLDKLDLKSSRIVEIGSGASTVYWSRKCKQITSYEFNVSWYEKLLAELKNNSMVNLQLVIKGESKSNLNDHSYLEANDRIKGLKDKGVSTEVLEEELMETALCGTFLNSLANSLKNANLVLIDGNYRNICSLMVGLYCPADSIVVLDNSEREDYNSGREALESEGFIEIPFCGLGPINSYSWTTSIYVKSLESFHYTK